MEEWTRLSPDDGIMVMGCRRADNKMPWDWEIGALALRGGRFRLDATLSDAEALAFTIATGNWRQVAEVEALVEAAHGLREFIRSFDMGGDWHQENYPAIKAYKVAVAPFEEA